MGVIAGLGSRWWCVWMLGYSSDEAIHRLKESFGTIAVTFRATDEVEAFQEINRGLEQINGGIEKHIAHLAHSAIGIDHTSHSHKTQLHITLIIQSLKRNLPSQLMCIRLSPTPCNARSQTSFQNQISMPSILSMSSRLHSFHAIPPPFHATPPPFHSTPPPFV